MKKNKNIFQNVYTDLDLLFSFLNEEFSCSTLDDQ